MDIEVAGINSIRQDQVAGRIDELTQNAFIRYESDPAHPRYIEYDLRLYADTDSNYNGQTTNHYLAREGRELVGSLIVTKQRDDKHELPEGYADLTTISFGAVAEDSRGNGVMSKLFDRALDDQKEAVTNGQASPLLAIALPSPADPAEEKKQIELIKAILRHTDEKGWATLPVGVSETPFKGASAMSWRNSDEFYPGEVTLIPQDPTLPVLEDEESELAAGQLLRTITNSYEIIRLGNDQDLVVNKQLEYAAAVDRETYEAVVHLAGALADQTPGAQANFIRSILSQITGPEISTRSHRTLYLELKKPEETTAQGTVEI